MIGRALATLLLAIVVGACESTAPSPPPEDPGPGFALGCLSIERLECEAVAQVALARSAVERGRPFSILVHLHGCPNDGPCPRSLAAREGMVTLEWPGPAEPIVLGVKGPPDAPQLADFPSAWSGLQEPASPRVAGPGPFDFTLGHCGLTWQVDFDGSFWVPIGDADGDASAIINAERGRMVLLGPNVARFTDPTGFTADLARFPGPKHVWLCA